PKLALCRADAISCKIQLDRDGGAIMHASDTEPRSRQRYGGSNPANYYQSRNVFSFARGTFPFDGTRHWRGEALVPTPPLHLRPKRGLQNYTVLWEAEWTK